MGQCASVEVGSLSQEKCTVTGSRERHPHLSEAPIREALLDIRVRPRPGFQTEQLQDLATALRSEFPKSSEQRRMSIEFGTSPSREERRDLGIDAIVLKSDDELTVCQLRESGFTFNRVAPYESWGKMFPLAMKSWTAFRDLAEPLEISRLAVRYINSIPYPETMQSVEEVLTAGPSIPTGVSSTLSAFLTRVTIHDERRDVSAHVIQALEVGADRRSSIILDIDAFYQRALPVDSPRVEETFDHLREFKNKIFFGSLTRATIERFL